MKKETAIYPSHRKLLGTTLAAAIMTTLSCLLVIVQPHGKVGLVIGIVGAVFFGGCICILFIVLLKNFFRNRPTLLLTPDSLRIHHRKPYHPVQSSVWHPYPMSSYHAMK